MFTIHSLLRVGYSKSDNQTRVGIRVVGRALLDAIVNGVHNASNGKIRLSGCAISNNDTEFAYAISAGGKLTKAQLLFVRTLAQGIAIGAQAESAFYLELDNSF